MADSAIPGARGRRAALRLLLVVAWCGLIFATSSTVITPRRFHAWIAAHALTDEGAFRRFAAFWGAGWFAIVKGWHAMEYAILYALLKATLDRIAPMTPAETWSWSWPAASSSPPWTSIIKPSSPSDPARRSTSRSTAWAPASRP